MTEAIEIKEEGGGGGGEEETTMKKKRPAARKKKPVQERAVVERVEASAPPPVPSVCYEVKPEPLKGKQGGVQVQYGVEVRYKGVLLGGAITAKAQGGEFSVEALDALGGEALLRDIRWVRGSAELRVPLPISLVFLRQKVEVRGTLLLARMSPKVGGRSFWHLLQGTYTEVVPYEAPVVEDPWTDVPNHPLRRPIIELPPRGGVYLY